MINSRSLNSRASRICEASVEALDRARASFIPRLGFCVRKGFLAGVIKFH